MLTVNGAPLNFVPHPFLNNTQYQLNADSNFFSIPLKQAPYAIDNTISRHNNVSNWKRSEKLPNQTHMNAIRNKRLNTECDTIVTGNCHKLQQMGSNAVTANNTQSSVSNPTNTTSISQNINNQNPTTCPTATNNKPIDIPTYADSKGKTRINTKINTINYQTAMNNTSPKALPTLNQPTNEIKQLNPTNCGPMYRNNMKFLLLGAPLQEVPYDMSFTDKAYLPYATTLIQDTLPDSTIPVQHNLQQGASQQSLPLVSAKSLTNNEFFPSINYGYTSLFNSQKHGVCPPQNNLQHNVKPIGISTPYLAPQSSQSDVLHRTPIPFKDCTEKKINLNNSLKLKQQSNSMYDDTCMPPVGWSQSLPCIYSIPIPPYVLNEQPTPYNPLLEETAHKFHTQPNSKATSLKSLDKSFSRREKRVSKKHNNSTRTNQQDTKSTTPDQIIKKRSNDLKPEILHQQCVLESSCAELTNSDQNSNCADKSHSGTHENIIWDNKPQNNEAIVSGVPAIFDCPFMRLPPLYGVCPMPSNNISDINKDFSHSIFNAPSNSNILADNSVLTAADIDTNNDDYFFELKKRESNLLETFWRGGILVTDSPLLSASDKIMQKVPCI